MLKILLKLKKSLKIEFQFSNCKNNISYVDALASHAFKLSVLQSEWMSESNFFFLQIFILLSLYSLFSLCSLYSFTSLTRFACFTCFANLTNFTSFKCFTDFISCTRFTSFTSFTSATSGRFSSIFLNIKRKGQNMKHKFRWHCNS